MGTARILSSLIIGVHSVPFTPPPTTKNVRLAKSPGELGESWDLKMFIEKIPILSLNAEEAELFCQYYSLLRSKMLGTPCKHQKELIDSLIQAFLYEFHDALERFIKLKPPTFTSGENLFKELGSGKP